MTLPEVMADLQAAFDKLTPEELANTRVLVGDGELWFREYGGAFQIGNTICITPEDRHHAAASRD